MVKVLSHVDASLIEGEVDEWVIRGNAAADTLASAVLANLPDDLAHALRRVGHARQRRHAAHISLQKFFIGVGQRDIALRDDTAMSMSKSGKM